MKQLAIRGDGQRSAEVIALLESLGGYNRRKYTGDSENAYYYLTSCNYIDFDELPCDEDDNKLYTLDEFWANFPYKVGDNVKIGFLNAKAEVKKMRWNEDKECIEYECEHIGNGELTTAIVEVEDLIPIGDEPAKDEPINIAEILKDAPKGTKLYSPVCGEVIFCKISDSDAYPIVVNDKNGEIATFTADGKYNADYLNGECMLFPSKDNLDWSTFKIEPQFPTSYEDCCEILGVKSIAERRLDLVQYPTNIGNSASYSCEFPYHIELNTLFKLLLARDAWWKVDNDWKPNWGNNMSKYNITTYFKETTKEEITGYNNILVFRTKVIRNKFYETFRDLIEQCKELI